MAISLAQVTGGQQLRNDVNALQKSYDAAKVITSIQKAAAEGETPAVMFSVDELLSQIKTTLDGVAGDGSDSISSLKQSIKDISERKVKDTVRMQYSVDYDAAGESYIFSGAAPSNAILSQVPGIDVTVALPVYTLDNKAVYDTEGNQLLFSYETDTFSGTPAKLDLSTSKTNSKDSANVEANILNYVPLNNSFSFKVFPVGTFELGSIPEAALLDNEEIDLLAYDKIINKIIVELAKDDDVVAAIVNKVGENTVAEQVTAITDALATRILALESGKFDKANVIADVTTTDEETGESSITEGAISAVADASNEKVVSEKVLARKFAAIQTAIENAGISADTTYVSKADVIRTDAEGEDAIKAIRTVAEASDDKVVSEKAIASTKATLDASIKEAKDAADAAQTSADGAVSKDDIVTEIHPLALVEGESGDVASDEKVPSEKAIVNKLQIITENVNTKLDSYVQKADVVGTLHTNVEDAAANNVASEIAVINGIKAANAEQTTAINALSTAITALSSEVQALNNIHEVVDIVAISGADPVTSFTLTEVPNSDKVQMFINGIMYNEGEDFTVDRGTKIVTWISNEFDINNELADKVKFVYKSGNKLSNNTGLVTILHQDYIPTTGTFRVGDLVFRLTMTQGNNIGWVCTEAGTPGAWTEFGVVDFGETIKVVEEDEEG